MHGDDIFRIRAYIELIDSRGNPFILREEIAVQNENQRSMQSPRLTYELRIFLQYSLRWQAYAGYIFDKQFTVYDYLKLLQPN